MAEDGCARQVVARGMCMYHYNRWRRPDPVIPNQKECTRCGEMKAADAFHRSKRGLRSWCRDCTQADNRERMRVRRYGTSDLGLTLRRCLGCATEFMPWRRDQFHCGNRACRAWTATLERKFGITPEHYRTLLESQGGGCAICQARPGAKRLAVDHDHATGAVRALLCQRCNLVLGQVGDDTSLLQTMTRYLN